MENVNFMTWLDNMKLSHPLLIAGPCSAESEEQVLEIAHELKKTDATVFRAGVWKPRTRPGSFEGQGTKALPWLQKVKKETGLLTAVEVGNAQHAKLALEFDIDILWIGARTTVNPFTVQEIADAIILLKNNSEFKNTLAENAYKRVRNEFAWSRKINEIENLIDN